MGLRSRKGMEVQRGTAQGCREIFFSACFRCLFLFITSPLLFYYPCYFPRSSIASVPWPEVPRTSFVLSPSASGSSLAPHLSPRADRFPFALQLGPFAGPSLLASSRSLAFRPSPFCGFFLPMRLPNWYAGSWRHPPAR